MGATKPDVLIFIYCGWVYNILFKNHNKQGSLEYFYFFFKSSYHTSFGSLTEKTSKGDDR